MKFEQNSVDYMDWNEDEDDAEVHFKKLDEIDEIEKYCNIMGWDFSIVGEEVLIKTRVIEKAIVL